MDSISQIKLQRFFESIATAFPPTAQARSVVVTHLLEDRPHFLACVDAVAPIVLLLPKPKSVNPRARALVTEKYRTAALSRRELSDPENALNFLEKYAQAEALVLLDVGGYFATSINHINAHYTGKIIGIVEDTENGHQKYEAVSNVSVPVYSVARSPLKNPEDYLVGQSIMFSAEALLRERGDILQGRRACVVGYGKLGRSIAQVLHSKNVRTVIYDSNPVTRVEALAHGFEITPHLRTGLAGANLVLCATGNIALRGEDFTHVANGAYIATVTSSDDELDLAGLRKYYREQRLDDFCTRYSTAGHYFYILNKGNAVNFVHGAVVGPFIQLVQAEIIACTSALLSDNLEPGLHSLNNDSRRVVATTWLEYFHP